MNTLRTAVIAAIFSLAAFAQSAPVSVEQGPPVNAWTSINKYTGSNLIYSCKARSTQLTYDYVGASQFTNVVVATNVGTVTTSANHGLAVGNTVTFAGSATTALNATYTIATVPSATTFTVTTSGVSNATYTNLTSLTTTAPRSNAGVWAIQKFTYDGSNNLIASQWASGNTGASRACDSTATLIYN